MASSAYGHGVSEIANFTTPRVPSENLPADANVPPGTLEAVVDLFKLWTTGSTIRACFYAGSNRVKGAFVQTSEDFTRTANLRIDYGQAPAYRSCGQDGADIRIAFEAKGNFSYVGTDALHPQLRTVPSLNVQNGTDGTRIFDVTSFEGTTRHELGHALAMEHEHQSPEANCDAEFNWPVVYERFKQVGWEQADVDFNMRTLLRSERLRTTPYDPQSIMHYFFEEGLFLNGRQSKCFVGHNDDASELDRQALARSYPASAAEQLILVYTRLGAVEHLLQEILPNPADRIAFSESVVNEVNENFSDLGASLDGESIEAKDPAQ